MLKEILAHMDYRPQRMQHLSLAIRLAQRLGARLIGLFPVEPPPAMAFVDSPTAIDILQRQLEEATRHAEKVQAEFEEATRREGIAAGWRRENGEAISLLVQHGRYADLIILPQEDEAGRSGRLLAGEVVLAVGRPVLVVPSAGGPKQTGERVLVAWNGSREATRALHDALPILRLAAEVAVLSVSPPGATSDTGSAEIAAHLAAHGVTATAEQIQMRDQEVGEVLLNAISDRGMDLLVMGAYGRSRLRELVLGGVSRDILAHMTVPVLMSH